MCLQIASFTQNKLVLKQEFDIPLISNFFPVYINIK